MKKNILYIALGILVALAISCKPLSQAQKADQQAKIKQAVEAKNFRVAVSYVNPSKLQPRSVSSGYDFTIRADSAFAYLPYFGEAYGATAYGDTEGGIKFKELMQDYKMTGSEQKGYEISFEVKAKRDTYQIFISISANGYATISITPMQASQIIYSGELVLKK